MLKYWRLQPLHRLTRQIRNSPRTTCKHDAVKQPVYIHTVVLLSTLTLVYSFRHCPALLPTGFEKSLCYKALPFVYYCSELCIIDIDSHKSLVLVISPLVCYPNGWARHRLLLLHEEVRLFYSSYSLTQISCQLLKHCCWTSSQAGKDGTKTTKTSHSCF